MCHLAISIVVAIALMQFLFDLTSANDPAQDIEGRKKVMKKVLAGLNVVGIRTPKVTKRSEVAIRTPRGGGAGRRQGGDEDEDYEDDDDDDVSKEGKKKKFKGKAKKVVRGQEGKTGLKGAAKSKSKAKAKAKTKRQANPDYDDNEDNDDDDSAKFGKKGRKKGKMTKIKKTKQVIFNSITIITTTTCGR